MLLCCEFVTEKREPLETPAALDRFERSKFDQRGKKLAKPRPVSLGIQVIHNFFGQLFGSTRQLGRF